VTRLAAALVLLLTLAAGCGGSVDGQADLGELLAVRDGSRLLGVDAATGERRFALPPGIASADGRRYVSAASAGERTTLTVYDARTGRHLSRRTVGGTWRLGAVSADGRLLALADEARGELAVLGPDAPLRRISLDGDFAVDAIASDGRSLFLIERLGGERYAVRLYDLVADRLHEGSIRPKNEDEEMVGVAGRQVGTRDGDWLLTLYVNTEEHEAFVHALNLHERFALCLDLPGQGAGVEALRGYALAVPRSGTDVYAANARLGVAARVSLLELGSVVPTTLATRARAPSTAAVSDDGRLLWVASGRTLQGLDTDARSLLPRRTLDSPATALAFGRDGLLYVVGGSGVVALDAATGSPPAA
jgi:hypothetical protein